MREEYSTARSPDAREGAMVGILSLSSSRSELLSDEEECLRSPPPDPSEEKSKASWRRERSKTDENPSVRAGRGVRVDSGSMLSEGGGLKFASDSPSEASADEGLEGGGVGTPMPR